MEAVMQYITSLTLEECEKWFDDYIEYRISHPLEITPEMIDWMMMNFFIEQSTKDEFF